MTRIYSGDVKYPQSSHLLLERRWDGLILLEQNISLRTPNLRLHVLWEISDTLPRLLCLYLGPFDVGFFRG